SALHALDANGVRSGHSLADGCPNGHGRIRLRRVVARHAEPVLPPQSTRCQDIRGTGAAGAAIAVGLPHVVGQQLERRARTFLYLRQTLVGTVGALVGQHSANDTADDHQPQDHRDQQLDQSKPARPFHICTVVCTLRVPPVSTADVCSSQRMVIKQELPLQSTAPVALAPSSVRRFVRQSRTTLAANVVPVGSAAPRVISNTPLEALMRSARSASAMVWVSTTATARSSALWLLRTVRICSPASPSMPMESTTAAT